MATANSSLNNYTSGLTGRSIKASFIFHIFSHILNYYLFTLYHIYLIENAALKAFNALMLKDYARVDIILKDDIPYVLEVNSLPGLMFEKSSLYRIAEAIDLGYEGLIFKIVESAIKRYNL